VNKECNLVFKRLVLVAFLVVLAVVPLTAAAQETVTDDEVNDIAEKLYCPVCENIPLDACGTAACEDWRYEIRLQLEAGMTEDAIINDFINRFGDRVVGTPRDPVLRGLSLITPWLLVAAGLVVTFMTLRRWQGNRDNAPNAPDSQLSADDYRSQLERDLQG
jgi:cytochrome c-type biogenesis protein CcmH